MFLLITGASGAGKSTVRAMVDQELSPLVECVELTHVLPLSAPPTLVWRQQATEAAVRRAVELQAEGRHLLLAGDPVAAAEVVAAPSAPSLDAIAVCLLDLSPDAQATRLAHRGDDPALLHHHHAFAEWMRRHADDPLHMTNVISTGAWEQMRWERLSDLGSDWQMTTIDTTDMTRPAVADEVLGWCRQALEGRTPSFRATGA
ncbi:MAG TPA: hypothetical protein VGM33_12755 [Baekduia sp.]